MPLETRTISNSQPRLKRLLWIGDSPHLRSGYGRVAREMCPILNKSYQVSVFGINNTEYTDLGYPVIDAQDQNSHWGFDKIVQVVNSIKPHFIVVLNDPAIVIQYLQRIKKNGEVEGTRILGYLCIDYKGIIEPHVREMETLMDGAIITSHFAEKELRKAGFEKPIYTAGHGFNQTSFYPLPLAEAKKTLGLDEDTFVIFSGNRNQPRKRLDIILRAFAQFISTRKEHKIILLMNCGMIDSGWHILEIFRRICRDIGIEQPERYLRMTTPSLQDPGVDDQSLNLFYNGSDIGVSASTGESWGLVNFEHGGVGRPQIVPNFTAFADIFTEGVIKLQAHDYMIHPISVQSVMGEGGVVDYREITRAFEKYYQNPSLRETDGKKIRNLVCSYTWDQATNDLDSALTDICDRVLDYDKEETVVKERVL